MWLLLLSYWPKKGQKNARENEDIHLARLRMELSQERHSKNSSRLPFETLLKMVSSPFKLGYSVTVLEGASWDISISMLTLIQIYFAYLTSLRIYCGTRRREEQGIPRTRRSWTRRSGRCTTSTTDTHKSLDYMLNKLLSNQFDLSCCVDMYKI